MAMAVTKGVLKSVRMANLRLPIQALDESRYCGVYRLERNARPRHGRLQPRERPARQSGNGSVGLATVLRNRSTSIRAGALRAPSDGAARMSRADRVHRNFRPFASSHRPSPTSYTPIGIM